MLSELFGLRSSLENPKISLQDTDAWEQMLGDGSKSASGIRVTKQSAMTVDAVFAAVSLISGAAARLPIQRFKRTEDDGRELDRNHPTYSLVRRSPNEEMDAFQFWRLAYAHLALWGRAYIWIERTNRGPVGLYNLLPDRTATERLKGSEILRETGNERLARQLDGKLVYVTESGNKLRTFFPEEIIHLRGLATDSMDGLDLVKCARNAIGLSLAQQKFASQFFKNGARMGGVLEIPAGMRQEAKDKLESGFRRHYEDSDAWFKTVVLRDGAKFQQAAFNPQDSQLVQATEAQVLSVARFFKIQPSKLGVSQSVSYNSKSEDNQAFLDDTLSDHLAAVEHQLNAKLLTSSEIENDSVYFEINRNALLQMNQLDRYSVYEIALRNRIVTRNEVRKKENMNPVAGGDEFDSFATTGAMGGQQQQQDNTPADAQQHQDNTPADAQRQQFLAAFCTRLASRAKQKARTAGAWTSWTRGPMEDFAVELRAEFGGELGALILSRLRKKLGSMEPKQASEVEQWNADQTLWQ